MRNAANLSLSGTPLNLNHFKRQRLRAKTTDCDPNERVAAGRN